MHLCRPKKDLNIINLTMFTLRHMDLKKEDGIVKYIRSGWFLFQLLICPNYASTVISITLYSQLISLSTTIILNLNLSSQM